MDESPEQVYSDLLRQLASPSRTAPEDLAEMFQEVERMHAIGRISDWQLQNAREAYARAPGGRIAEAVSGALDQAAAGLHAGAELVGDRTRAALVTYTREEPVRAILIAAGTGALLMGVLSMLARSGARRVGRRLRG